LRFDATSSDVVARRLQHEVEGEDMRRSVATAIVLGTVMIVGIVAIPPAAASDIAPFTTIRSTDVAFAGFGGMRDNGTGTLTVSGVSGTVTNAFLYWHGPTNSDNPAANAAVKFAGHNVVGTNIGFSSDNCWDFSNSQAYRADVTSFVTGNGSYALANFVKSSGAINVNGVSLIVFYQDGNTANDRDVVLFDGNDSNVPNPFDADGWNVTLAGIDYTSGSASITLHVSDGQSFNDDAITLNDQTLVPTGPIFSGDSVPAGAFDSDGHLWDIKTYNITSFLSPGPNTLQLTSGAADDCLSLVAAAINLPAGAAPPTGDADLSITKSDTEPGFGPDPVSAGQRVAYRLDVANAGPDDAPNVTVTDTPSSGKVVSATGDGWTCSVTATKATCTTPSIASDASAASPITVVVKAPASGTITDTANVTSDADDPDSEDNTSTETTTVTSATTADRASGFYDGAHPLTLSTVFGAGDLVKSTLVIPKPSGRNPFRAGPVVEQEFPATASQFVTFCGGQKCDAQVAVANPVPTGSQPDKPIVLVLTYGGTAKPGNNVYGRGDDDPSSHLLPPCDSPGVARVGGVPAKCVASITIVNGDKKVVTINIADGGDPAAAKR
jgi:uncharacterized repeat protein (TIGR01451 family)